MESGDITGRGGRRLEEVEDERKAKIRLVVGWTTILIALIFLAMTFGYIVFSTMLQE